KSRFCLTFVFHVCTRYCARTRVSKKKLCLRANCSHNHQSSKERIFSSNPMSSPRHPRRINTVWRLIKFVSQSCLKILPLTTRGGGCSWEKTLPARLPLSSIISESENVISYSGF